MTPRMFTFALAAFALALTSRLHVAAENKAEKDTSVQEVPYEKLDETGKNVVKLTTAMKLKEIGWGTDVKGGRPEGGTVENLLAAARMLRELPQAKEIDPKDIVVTPAKDTPKGETPKAKVFDPVAESKVLLDRAKLIVDTFEDPKQKELFTALIAATEKINTRAVLGGPKVVSKIIYPGETHTYHFTAVAGLPSAIAAETDGKPLRFKLFRSKDGHQVFNQVVKAGALTWVAGGGAAGTHVSFTLEVVNHSKVAAAYIVAVE